MPPIQYPLCEMTLQKTIGVVSTSLICCGVSGRCGDEPPRTRSTGRTSTAPPFARQVVPLGQPVAFHERQRACASRSPAQEDTRA